MNISTLIEKYMADIATARAVGQSHYYTMRRLQSLPIGQIEAHKLQPSDILDLGRLLRKTMAPSTVAQYITYLRGPLGYAKIGYGLDGVSIQPIIDAQPMLEKFQIVGKGRPRERRPSADEQTRILDYFRARAGGCKIPMHVIVEFQILSCRRIGETCRLKWGDVDMENRTCIVRDMKDPKQKKGNDHRFALLGRAWDLVLQQPRVTNSPNERIFPYNSKSVGAAYTRAKKALGIENLRLHDSRREGASKMFEEGYSVPEVLVQTGHRNSNMLMRVYTKLSAADLHAGPISRKST